MNDKEQWLVEIVKAFEPICQEWISVQASGHVILLLFQRCT